MSRNNGSPTYPPPRVFLISHFSHLDVDLGFSRAFCIIVWQGKKGHFDNTDMYESKYFNILAHFSGSDFWPVHTHPTLDHASRNPSKMPLVIDGMHAYLFEQCSWLVKMRSQPQLPKLQSHVNSERYSVIQNQDGWPWVNSRVVRKSEHFLSFSISLLVTVLVCWRSLTLCYLLAWETMKSWRGGPKMSIKKPHGTHTRSTIKCLHLLRKMFLTKVWKLQQVYVSVCSSLTSFKWLVDGLSSRSSSICWSVDYHGPPNGIKLKLE